MQPALTLAPRRLGAVNWLGLWTLYLKEVRRFAKVFTQTLVSPLVTTLLFLAIFTLALWAAASSRWAAWAMPSSCFPGWS